MSNEILGVIGVVIVVIAIVLLLFSQNKETILIFDEFSSNIDLSNIKLDKYSRFAINNCSNGVIARKVGGTDFICRSSILPTIKQGVFGYTTLYTEINCFREEDPEFPQFGICGTSYIGTKVYVATFDKNKNKFQIVKTLESKKEFDGFFEIALPKGVYLVFSDCNMESFNAMEGLGFRHRLKEDGLKRAVEDYGFVMVDVNKNHVVEATHGVHCNYHAV